MGDPENGHGHGRLAFISWQQLVTVVLPIIVAIVTGGVVVANVMLSRMEGQLRDQYQDVRELTHNLYTVQEQLAVIRAQQSKFHMEQRDQDRQRDEEHQRQP